MSGLEPLSLAAVDFESTMYTIPSHRHNFNRLCTYTVYLVLQNHLVMDFLNLTKRILNPLCIPFHHSGKL